MDRDYIRLVVYYLYTLRVCSGSQQTRYIVSIVAAPENLTHSDRNLPCPARPPSPALSQSYAYYSKCHSSLPTPGPPAQSANRATHRAPSRGRHERLLIQGISPSHKKSLADVPRKPHPATIESSSLSTADLHLSHSPSPRDPAGIP